MRCSFAAHRPLAAVRRLPGSELSMSDTLTKLAETIRARRSGPPEASYTRQLLDAGPEKCARKLGEEAVETVIAGLQQSDEALTKEAADLLYHLIVLLESREIPFQTVLDVLDSRSGTSGLAEKAARQR